MKKIILFVMMLFTSLSVYAEEHNTKESLELLKSKLNKLGEPKIEGTEKVGDKEVPALYFGDKKINNNFSIVDDVKKIKQGTATVFVKQKDEFIRISTNVLTATGTRGIGTFLAKNDAYKAIIKGETFCGEVEILGSKYDTCYEPIKKGTEILGVYYVGYKK